MMGQSEELLFFIVFAYLIAALIYNIATDWEHFWGD